MSSHEGDVPPGTFALASMMQEELLAGVDPDTAFDKAKHAAPAVWIARAALALMPEQTTAKAAVLRLFHDPGLQEAVLDTLDDPALQHTVEASHGHAFRQRRISELRERGNTGVIDIRDLSEGELIRLVYEQVRRLGNRQSALHIARNQRGTEDNTLTITIIRTEGVSMGPQPARLRNGQTMFFGAQRGDYWLDPVLRRGAVPAWADSIKSGRKRWVYSRVQTDRRFSLIQAYYGQSDAYPLFPE